MARAIQANKHALHDRQAADTVIMYDTDWNPQMDLQAQARAHRMGQQRDVRVVRLVTADSIEEHMVRVAATKRDVAEASITGALVTAIQLVYIPQTNIRGVL